MKKNKKISLEKAFSQLDKIVHDIEDDSISLDKINQTSWFGGRLYPGDSTYSTFKIENPTNKNILAMD